MLRLKWLAEAVVALSSVVCSPCFLPWANWSDYVDGGTTMIMLIDVEATVAVAISSGSKRGDAGGDGGCGGGGGGGSCTDPLLVGFVPKFP